MAASKITLSLPIKAYVSVRVPKLRKMGCVGVHLGCLRRVMGVVGGVIGNVRVAVDQQIRVVCPVGRIGPLRIIPVHAKQTINRMQIIRVY